MVEVWYFSFNPSSSSRTTPTMLASSNMSIIVNLAMSLRVKMNFPYEATKVLLSQLHLDTKSSRSWWCLVNESSLEQDSAFFTHARYILLVNHGRASTFKHKRQKASQYELLTQFSSQTVAAPLSSILIFKIEQRLSRFLPHLDDRRIGSNSGGGPLRQGQNKVRLEWRHSDEAYQLSPRIDPSQHYT